MKTQNHKSFALKCQHLERPTAVFRLRSRQHPADRYPGPLRVENWHEGRTGVSLCQLRQVLHRGCQKPLQAQDRGVQRHGWCGAKTFFFLHNILHYFELDWSTICRFPSSRHPSSPRSLPCPFVFETPLTLYASLNLSTCPYATITHHPFMFGILILPVQKDSTGSSASLLPSRLSISPLLVSSRHCPIYSSHMPTLLTYADYLRLLCFPFLCFAPPCSQVTLWATTRAGPSPQKTETTTSPSLTVPCLTKEPGGTRTATGPTSTANTASPDTARWVTQEAILIASTGSDNK